jgi:septum site-determining protein MinD
MSRIIVVTSGKGGVGKTTTSASFASGLALRGHKTAVIDFDVGLRNLDLIMGCERRVVYDLINVIHGEAGLNQALIKDKQCDNLFVLAASQTRDKDALTLEGVERVLEELAGMDFEYIVCDSPAGLETGALMAMHFADDALVVTNPEVSSVRDSDRILGMLNSKTRRAIEKKAPVQEHLLITRYNPNRVEDGHMLSLKDILSNKQARGAYGQARMEAIIRDGLPSSAYAFQGTLSNNTRPDCLVSLPDSNIRLVIDAKFPLEAFNALKAASGETELRNAEARLRGDRMALEAQIIGAEIGGAMRQKADARQRREAAAFNDLRQDFLYGAIPGADEQVGDAVARHAVDHLFEKFEALEQVQ